MLDRVRCRVKVMVRVMIRVRVMITVRIRSQEALGTENHNSAVVSMKG